MENKKRIRMQIRIPYCPFDCTFCRENLSHDVSASEKERYMRALEKEISVSAEDYAEFCIDTIQVCGGIASAVNADSLNRLLRLIRKHYTLAEDVGILLKMFPGTLSVSSLAVYRNARVTALEFACFTAMPYELACYNVPESFESMRISAAVMRNSGYNGSFGLQCFYGVPTQTRNTWIKTLGEACNLNPDVLTLLPFPVEENTGLDFPAFAREYLPTRGYQEYERLVFAKEGKLWRIKRPLPKDADYISFGLGAASRLGGIDYRNTRDMARYLQFSDDFTQITEIL